MTLLPPSSTPLELGLERATDRIDELPVALRDLWNANTCPLPLLPYLAWGVSIDGWDPDWPEAIKRRRVKQAISVQRRKGTAASIRSVVEAFGGTIAIREWWQTVPRGTPHTFDLTLSLNDISGNPRDADFVDAVIAEVRRTKPVRSHFTFSQALSATGAFGTVGVARPAIFRRLAMSAPAA